MSTTVALKNKTKFCWSQLHNLYIAYYETKYRLKVIDRGNKILKLQKIAILSSLYALIVLSLFTSTAYGISGNFTPDSTPYVGVVVLFSDTARTNPIGYCSGFLVSPTVMLTAGHCTFGAAAVSVCFDKGPIDYSIQNGKIVYSGKEIIYAGRPLTYPEYTRSVLAGTNNGEHILSCSDLGLIILNKPVKGVTNFPTLPQTGFVDTIDIKTNLNEVGYGAQFQVTPKDNGIINSWEGTLSCNTATAQLVSGSFAGSDKYLRLTANPSQGKGGIAFGDSGGPVLYQANDGNPSTVLAVNAYVDNSNCAGVTYHTRIDTPQVLAWIKENIGA